jgi:hypothetical protein
MFFRQMLAQCTDGVIPKGYFTVIPQQNYESECYTLTPPIKFLKTLHFYPAVYTC